MERLLEMANAQVKIWNISLDIRLTIVIRD
jgi:hypothetical protein